MLYEVITNSFRPFPFSIAFFARHASFSLRNSPNTADPLPVRAAASAPASLSSLLMAGISCRSCSQALSKSFPTAATRSSHARKEGGDSLPGTSATFRPSLSYPSRVGSPKGGITITAKKGTFHTTGVSSSPNPSTSAGQPSVKNGTSAPTAAARDRRVSGGGDFPVRAISPFSVAAASELPPPSPACSGMVLRTRTPSGAPAHSRKETAALWQLFLV